MREEWKRKRRRRTRHDRFTEKGGVLGRRRVLRTVRANKGCLEMKSAGD